MRWVVGAGPSGLQFDVRLWTTRVVKELIEREFGVVYSRQWVGELLRLWGLSAQRLLVRAYEQDQVRVEAWRRVEYPALRAAAKEAGAKIFFADEDGVRNDYHSGTTWAPVGKTPVVRGTGSRVSVSMIRRSRRGGSCASSWWKARPILRYSSGF
ncbi:hypothetical protein KEM60_03255 [Austwickia sp. TVS 96-490-7B]|nr:hypothetical protein [Austwickia sp. TVS 96-490-7B]